MGGFRTLCHEDSELGILCWWPKIPVGRRLQCLFRVAFSIGKVEQIILLCFFGGGGGGGSF